MLQDTNDLLQAAFDYAEQFGRVQKAFESWDSMFRCSECGLDVVPGSNICTDCLTKLMVFAPEPKKRKYYSDGIEEGDCPF